MVYGIVTKEFEARVDCGQVALFQRPESARSQASTLQAFERTRQSHGTCGRLVRSRPKPLGAMSLIRTFAFDIRMEEILASTSASSHLLLFTTRDSLLLQWSSFSDFVRGLFHNQFTRLQLASDRHLFAGGWSLADVQPVRPSIDRSNDEGTFRGCDHT